MWGGPVYFGLAGSAMKIYKRVKYNRLGATKLFKLCLASRNVTILVETTLYENTGNTLEIQYSK
jgi:hypothetical protein